ncbi:hypothetical protein HETIRDRAFT_391084 [Heterobasidion irregulare TC 32-1]|uniref:CUE domain-containing protein n=1 Tax=Heterobasidion irregulare (strain TC 32-1) TaxID=747525 RepID=W4JPG5_HETIT|nr:uncharacterized protein HETIRDRAFT_391084 [Heterobasidion irregulare TC 32-1]ETW75462.1 hypothetical protein HETIRDRAFT_391084 [Heterobasidion irregulare TC 32-1]
MGEVVNVIVAFAVIVFIFRWATSSGGEPSPEAAAARALRFRPKNVTPEMTDTISGMFPDIPRENIHYDLLRTGSVELTSNKILERGFLDAPPPAYFTLYTRSSTAAATATAAVAGAGARATAATAASAKRKPETLISRFRLEDRVAAEPDASADAALPAPEEAGGRAVWEDSAEKREASLRERKAQMVLAARQRMLAQQQQQQKAAAKAS